MSNIKSSLLPLTCIFISMLSRRTRATETPVAPSRSPMFLRNVRWSVKSPPVSCFRRFDSITIDNCVKECAARRQRCRAINYRRLYKVCDLCTDADGTAFISDIRSVIILMDDDLLKMVSKITRAPYAIVPKEFNNVVLVRIRETNSVDCSTTITLFLSTVSSEGEKTWLSLPE